MSIKCSKRDVSDCIYGQINLPNICWAIIDTPQFQRLRNIKQLGTCDYVYPSAEHTRKQHCMGVAYLAGLALKTLIANHEDVGPKLDLTKEEVLMVQIAGLCHDLGHGPFSHVFDGHFLPTVKPNEKHKHEKWSVEMFKRLLEDNPPVKEEFDKAGFTAKDIIFIQEALSGIPMGNENDPWPYAGRGPDKAYLYELISNQRCGVDVDRFDYFLRDAKYLKIKTMFDRERLFQNMRVLKFDFSDDKDGSDVRSILAFRDKAESEISNMGATRAYLHKKAYQHKTANVIELMLLDVLLAVDDQLLYVGKNGKMWRLSETVNDMVAFEKVDDQILRDIKRLLNSNPNIAFAQQLLKDIDSRRLYRLVGEHNIHLDVMNENVALKTILESPKSVIDDICANLEKVRNSVHVDASITIEKLKSCLALSISDINHGMQSDAPSSKCLFYTKDDPETPKTYQEIKFANQMYEPNTVRLYKIFVFCRERDNTPLCNAMDLCFKQWLENYGLNQVGNNNTVRLSLNVNIVLPNLNTPPSSPRY